MTDTQNTEATPTRVPVDLMSDRDLLIEIVENMRATVDAITALEQLPIVRAMQNGENPLLAMMSRKG